MPSRPPPVPQPAEAGRGGAPLAVAVLEAGGGLAGLLAGAGVAVRAARTLDELAGLAEAGVVEAAVVDPELGEGWPADVAEAAAGRLAGQVPLILVCRSEHDVRSIRARTSGRGAVVLARDGLSPEGVAAVLAGEVAKRRAGA